MSLFFFIFGFALAAIGGAFLAIIYYIKKKQNEADQTYNAWAEAELVDWVNHIDTFDERTHDTFHGIYTFETEQGMRVKTESDYGYGAPEDIPGPVVKIRYNPADPLEFVIPEEQASTSSALPGFQKTGIGLLVLGISLLAAGVVFLGK